ncbi:MAG: thymidylate kinase, partial [Fusobacteriaceae bacterium]|nr:thymidylate kinase [Fusobacteriaceae bacterium]
EYLERSYKNACEISKKYLWEEIECVENDEIKSIERINDEIYQKIKNLLDK